MDGYNLYYGLFTEFPAEICQQHIAFTKSRLIVRLSVLVYTFFFSNNIRMRF